MNEDGTVKKYEFCKADADIWLKSIYSYQEEIKEVYEKKIYTGEEEGRFFIMIGTGKIQIPCMKNEYEMKDVIEEKKQLSLFENYYIPVYIGRNISREYNVEKKIYNKDEIKALFESKIQKIIVTLEEKGVQIIEKNVTINKTAGIWHMKVDFLVIEKTGLSRPTHLQQVEACLLYTSPSPRD